MKNKTGNMIFWAATLCCMGGIIFGPIGVIVGCLAGLLVGTFDRH